MKKKEVLASVDELKEEGLGKVDTWSGYHGRQKTLKLYLRSL
jgi:hypothetical protein